MNILIVMHDFRGGGAEKVAITLANFMSINHTVTLACVNEQGEFRDDLSLSVNVVNFNKSRVLSIIPNLIDSVRLNNYDLIISHLTHVNVATILASLFANTLKKTVVVEHSQLLQNFKKQKQLSVKLAYFSTKLLYCFPRYVVGVSAGVSQSVISFTLSPRRKNKTIYNPVVNSKIREKNFSRPTHEFFDNKKPVFICVGRLIDSKKLCILLDSFTLVLTKFDANLLILGDGPEMEALKIKTKRLGIENNVSFLGFVSNPYPYIHYANTLVMTSIWEGLPTVLIEALALETQVVSTDCPSGPSEILCNGKYGYLCQMNNIEDIASKMVMSIESPIDISDSDLIRFDVENTVKQYLECAL